MTKRSAMVSVPRELAVSWLQSGGFIREWDLKELRRMVDAAPTEDLCSRCSGTGGVKKSGGSDSCPDCNGSGSVAPAEDVRAVADEPLAYVPKVMLEEISSGRRGFICAFKTQTEYMSEPLYRRPQRPVVPAIDFNEEIVLPRPDGVRTGFCDDVKLSFDSAEYQGRAWLLDVERDDMIAIEGPENCRKAGEALIAWAEAWEGKS